MGKRRFGLVFYAALICMHQTLYLLEKCYRMHSMQFVRGICLMKNLTVRVPDDAWLKPTDFIEFNYSEIS